MFHAFIFWLVTSLSAVLPACSTPSVEPDSGPPPGTYTQHEGRVVTEHRPAEVGPVVTIPPACPAGESMPEDQSGCLPDGYWAPVCTEDMDCWDCHTMGNLMCGPTTVAD